MAMIENRDNDLRNLVNGVEYNTFDDISIAKKSNEGRILGLTAGERMVISMIMLMTTAVLSTFILFVTGTFILR